MKSSWAQRIDGLLSARCVATPQDIQKTPFNTDSTALPSVGEHNSDAYHPDGVSGFPGTQEKFEAVEEDMTRRKRQESDFMLAQVYYELARASQDMATWSHATAVGASPSLYLRRFVDLGP